MKTIYEFGIWLICGVLMVSTQAGLSLETLAFGQGPRDSQERQDPQDPMSAEELAQINSLTKKYIKPSNESLVKIKDSDQHLKSKSLDEPSIQLPEPNEVTHQPELTRSSDPVAQKFVLQDKITVPGGVEVRPEVGKFSSSNFDIADRNYVGVTGTVHQTISDTAKILVSMHLGRYSGGIGSDGKPGAVNAIKTEVRKNLGQNFYVGTEAVFQGLNKRKATNPVLEGASGETKIRIFGGAAF